MIKILRLLTIYCIALNFGAMIASANSLKANTPAATPVKEQKLSKKQQAAITAAQKADYTKEYKAAEAKGEKALNEFRQNTSRNGSLQENEWMNDLHYGERDEKGKRQKNKDKKGKKGENKKSGPAKPKGFNGDPNDPGPQDWSDFNIKTDGKGNVIGFEEKNFEEKDADGDGKISKEERTEWDKKKKKEHEENGGAPGEVPPVADWDKDGDGIVDAGFERWCWQCFPGDKQLNECHHNPPGPCSDDPCSISEVCTDAPEMHNGVDYACHRCEHINDQTPWCEERGYSSDRACGGQCSPLLCVPIDVDKRTGGIVPTNRTRERNSTQPCYTCMTVSKIEIEYVIIIIETPYGRVVLDKNGKEGFVPSAMMALAKVDEASGMIQSMGGDLHSITDFMGSFNIGGFNPLGLLSSGKIGMNQLSSLLSSSMQSKGNYGMDCFNDATEAADTQAQEAGTPTSSDIEGTNKERKKDKLRRDREIFTKEEVKKANETGNPAISGPIIACGNEDRNKVLKIYDASGRLFDTITEEMVSLDPGIILKKMGLAQQLSDKFSQMSRSYISKYIEKFTGIPVGRIQHIATQAKDIKSKVDGLVDKGRKKKKKKKTVKPPKPIYPNDPLYHEAYKGKKKKLLGVLGSSKGTPKIEMGSIVKMGQAALEAKKANTPDVKDQWGLHTIGFTPWDDPNSAWNVLNMNQRNMVVAVIDSGLDMTHPDGPTHIWTNPNEIPNNNIDDDGNGFVDDIHGWNFVHNNHDFTDIRGHGTFVAGIIAAKTNNGIGIAGINPGAVIMPVKVADEDGETDSFHIYQGINYAISHGAKILNVSLGGRSISKMEQVAISRANALGVLVVVASGNNNENLMRFGPASSKDVLSVGQIDLTGMRSTVSNWGPNLGLLGPGEQIYSLVSKDNKNVRPSVRKYGYYKQDGTSFSTPMVAATASLIWAKDPTLKKEQVIDILMASATNMDAPGWDGMTGAGLLNASAALRTDSTNIITAMITNLRLNSNAQKKTISLDVYGTVRGPFKSYTLEIGKGKRAKKFKTVAGPFTQTKASALIDRVMLKEHLRGSSDWIIRLNVLGADNQEHHASVPYTLE